MNTNIPFFFCALANGGACWHGAAIVGFRRSADGSGLGQDMGLKIGGLGWMSRDWNLLSFPFFCASAPSHHIAATLPSIAHGNNSRLINTQIFRAPLQVVPIVPFAKFQLIQYFFISVWYLSPLLYLHTFVSFFLLFQSDKVWIFSWIYCIVIYIIPEYPCTMFCVPTPISWFSLAHVQM